MFSIFQFFFSFLLFRSHRICWFGALVGCGVRNEWKCGEFYSCLIFLLFSFSLHLSLSLSLFTWDAIHLDPIKAACNMKTQPGKILLPGMLCHTWITLGRIRFSGGIYTKIVALACGIFVFVFTSDEKGWDSSVVREKTKETHGVRFYKFFFFISFLANSLSISHSYFFCCFQKQRKVNLKRNWNQKHLVFGTSANGKKSVIHYNLFCWKFVGVC